MNLHLTVAVLFLFAFDRCFGYRKVHKTVYDSSDLRAYLFGSPSILETYFSFDPSKTIFIIKEPSNPIVYESHNYYWNGYYESHSDSERICIYNITEIDNELTKVRFQNGTNPFSLIFECGKWDECCGSKCCNHISGFLIIMGCLFFLFSIAAGVFYFDC
uniref:CX domain-containing protein n=1 Tax=Caenorhabditis tropicalis TaxID=1561998 RepID=A0A1I7UKF3_9PELO